MSSPDKIMKTSSSRHFEMIFSHTKQSNTYLVFTVCFLGLIYSMIIMARVLFWARLFLSINEVNIYVEEDIVNEKTKW